MCYKTTLCRLCSHHPTLQHPGVHRAASSCTARPLCSMHLPGAAAQGGEKKRKGGKMKGNVAEVLIKGFFSTSSLVFTASLSCFAFINILLVPNRPPLSHGSVLHWGTRRDGRLQVLLGEIPWYCGKVTHTSLDRFLLPQPAQSSPAVQRGVHHTSSFFCPFSFSIRHLPAFPNHHPSFLCLTNCKNNPDCNACSMFTGHRGNSQLKIINFK